MKFCSTCADDRCPNRDLNRAEQCEEWTGERPANGHAPDPFDRIDAEIKALHGEVKELTDLIGELLRQWDRFGALFIEARREDER